MKPFVILAALAVPLAAAAGAFFVTRADTGQWETKEARDPITDQTVIEASVWSRDRSARLSVLCGRGGRTTLGVRFAERLAGMTEDLNHLPRPIQYRIDAAPPIPATTMIIDDAMLFDDLGGGRPVSSSRPIIDALPGAQTLGLEVHRLSDERRVTAEFDVSGWRDVAHDLDERCRHT